MPEYVYVTVTTPCNVPLPLGALSDRRLPGSSKIRRVPNLFQASAGCAMLLQGSVRRMNRNVIPSSAFVILYYMDFLLKCNFHPGIFFRFIRVFSNTLWAAASCLQIFRGIS